MGTPVAGRGVPADRADAPDGRAGWTWLDAAALAGVLAVAAVLGALRWPGAAPFGSDHDEYRLVADALWSTGQPLVAGVEGTKYPVGYPALLGLLDRLGLDMTPAALALNVLLAAGLVTLVWVVARRHGRLAGVAAGMVVAADVTVWDATHAVMPDMALASAVAATLVVLLRAERAAHVALLAVLVALATSMKTVGIVLGVGVAAALLGRRAAPAVRRWWWGPPVAGLATAAVQMALVAPHPQHTTGYWATFWLRDPGDAAAGRVGLGDVVARVWERGPLVLQDVAAAVFGPQVPGPLAAALAVVAVVACAVWLRRARWFVGVYALATLVVLAVWPFRSARFGLMLLPVAAVGVGAVAGWSQHAAARLLARRRSVPSQGRVLPQVRGGRVAVAGVVAAVLAVQTAGGAVRARADGAAEQRRLVTLHADTADAVAWIRSNVPADQPLASMDYREIAVRLGRPVLPLPYTSDVSDLWAAGVGRGAEWLVVIDGLYARRQPVLERLLDARSDSLDLAHRSGRVSVYRVI